MDTGSNRGQRGPNHMRAQKLVHWVWVIVNLVLNQINGANGLKLGTNKDRILCFVTWISHNFTFVPRAAIDLTRKNCQMWTSFLSHCRFLGNPGTQHWNEAKCMLSCLKGTSHHAIQYSSNMSLIRRVAGYSCSVGMRLTEGHVKGFCDSNWAGCVDTHQSTSGFVWMMNGGAICWRSKLQTTVALLLTEVEYVRATPAIQEVIWLRDLLHKLNVANASPLCYRMTK